MWDWKNDKRVKFAIGVAVTAIAVKWLFTGTPLFAIFDFQAAPEDGQTKSGVAIAAVLPVVIDLVVGIFVGVGAWVMNIGEVIAGFVSSRVHAVDSGSATAGAPVLSEDSLTKKLVVEFASAAQVNDLQQLEALRVQLRMPMAMDELQAAYRAGDLESASTLNTELQTLITGPKPLSASAKRKAGQ